jgi:hypothetical protein
VCAYVCVFTIQKVTLNTYLYINVCVCICICTGSIYGDMPAKGKDRSKVDKAAEKEVDWCVCVCVCVRERERERVCMFVLVCV